MGSRHPTELERARLPGPSRRAVLAGTSAAALSAHAPAVATPAIAPVLESQRPDPYKAWLHLTAKIERLQTRWAKLESWLAREHSWLQLSHSEQQALPWAKELRDIDGCLDVLFERREALMERLPARGAVTLETIVAKLAVVEHLVARDDHPEAHAMIAGARADLLLLVAAGDARD